MVNVRSLLPKSFFTAVSNTFIYLVFLSHQCLWYDVFRLSRRQREHSMMPCVSSVTWLKITALYMAAVRLRFPALLRLMKLLIRYRSIIRS